MGVARLAAMSKYNKTKTNCPHSHKDISNNWTWVVLHIFHPILILQYENITLQCPSVHQLSFRITLWWWSHLEWLFFTYSVPSKTFSVLDPAQFLRAPFLIVTFSYCFHWCYWYIRWGNSTVLNHKFVLKNKWKFMFHY